MKISTDAAPGLQHDGEGQSDSVDSKSDFHKSQALLPRDTKPDIYPMRCPGIQCLFGLGDGQSRREYQDSMLEEPLSHSTRTRGQAVPTFPKGRESTVPHPSCSLEGFVLQD